MTSMRYVMIEHLPPYPRQLQRCNIVNGRYRQTMPACSSGEIDREIDCPNIKREVRQISPCAIIIQRQITTVYRVRLKNSTTIVISLKCLYILSRNFTQLRRRLFSTAFTHRTHRYQKMHKNKVEVRFLQLNLPGLLLTVID